MKSRQKKNNFFDKTTRWNNVNLNYLFISIIINKKGTLDQNIYHGHICIYTIAKSNFAYIAKKTKQYLACNLIFDSKILQSNKKIHVNLSRYQK